MATSKTRSKPRLQLVEKPIGWLKTDEGSLKIHTEDQLDMIESSVKRFGFRDPIACMPDGKILEGYGRYMTAKQRLLMRKVPVLIINDLDERAARAYAVAHNQSTLNTGLDNTAVREEFQRLGVEESDFISLGFTVEDAAFLLDDTPGNGTQDRGERNGNPPEVIVTTLHFGSKEQHDRFTQFLTALRLRYPDRPSIAARLDAFAAEYGNNL